MCGVDGCVYDGQSTPQPKKTVSKNHLHPLQDKSWRVRYNVAQQIPTLTEAFGKDAVQQQLGTLFVSLLQDPEAEVRCVVVVRLLHACMLCGNVVMCRCCPHTPH